MRVSSASVVQGRRGRDAAIRERNLANRVADEPGGRGPRQRGRSVVPAHRHRRPQSPRTRADCPRGSRLDRRGQPPEPRVPLLRLVHLLGKVVSVARGFEQLPAGSTPRRGSARCRSASSTVRLRSRGAGCSRARARRVHGPALGAVDWPTSTPSAEATISLLRFRSVSVEAAVPRANSLTRKHLACDEFRPELRFSGGKGRLVRRA